MASAVAALTTVMMSSSSALAVPYPATVFRRRNRRLRSGMLPDPDGFSLRRVPAFSPSAPAPYGATSFSTSALKEPGAPRIHSASSSSPTLTDVCAFRCSSGRVLGTTAATVSHDHLPRVWKRLHCRPSIAGAYLADGVPRRRRVTAPWYASLADRTVDFMVDFAASSAPVPPPRSRAAKQRAASSSPAAGARAGR